MRNYPSEQAIRAQTEEILDAYLALTAGGLSFRDFLRAREAAVRELATGARRDDGGPVSVPAMRQRAERKEKPAGRAEAARGVPSRPVKETERPVSSRTEVAQPVAESVPEDTGGTGQEPQESGFDILRRLGDRWN